MSRPLENITVLELGTHMAIPLAARMLSDWGASVIKVEPPHGEAWRTIGRSYGVPFEPDNTPVFQTPNANKKSIAMNLKTPEGREIMLRLLKKTDIFLTNTRLRSLKKLGLDYDTLKEACPNLIYAHFSAYGNDGPDKDRPGFDLAAFWARGGMPVEWTQAGHPPFRPMPGFGDSTVSPSIVSAVLAALYHRRETGIGEYIETSLYACALWYNNLGVVVSQPKYGNIYPRSKYDQTAPYNTVFKSQDGMSFIFSIPNWNQVSERFLHAIHLDEYLNDPRFITLEGAKEDMQTVMDALDSAFRSMTSDEIRAMFQEQDFVFEEFSNPSNITTDQQAWENGYLESVELECGEDVVLANNPLRMQNVDTTPFGLAPQLGRDSQAILADLGYDRQIIDSYLENKIIIQNKREVPLTQGNSR